jgi:DNA-binding IclR family transcriptional regulator
LLFRLSGKIGYTIQGKASPAQLVKSLTPNIRNLKEITNETTYLSIWDQEEITTAVVAESPLSVRVRALEVGFCEANHATALGKAILAYLEEEEIDRFLDTHGMKAYTAHTITSVAAFKAYLAKVRQQGFSLDKEEYFPDVYCIGTPIFDAGGKIIASVAIALPGSRYHQSGDKLLPEIMRTARNATRTMRILGYCGPAEKGGVPQV